MDDSAQATISKTSIDGLVVIERPVFRDERGFFHEVYRQSHLEKITGVNFKPVQFNHSMNKPRVIRAFHTEEWNKMVYPATGKMFAAIVDVRPDSETFGEVEEIMFDNTKEDSTHKALFLPAGMGNSICAMGDEPIHYFYAVDEYWDNSKAKGIAWDDPDIGVEWPIDDPIISERDMNNPSFREVFPEKFEEK